MFATDFSSTLKTIQPINTSGHFYEILPLAFSSPKVDLPEFKSVDDWLMYINMEKYSETFQAAGIENLNKVTMLEDKDLSEIGIKLIGHRNKMNKSIKAMKSQYYNKGMDNEEA